MAKVALIEEEEVHAFLLKEGLVVELGGVQAKITKKGLVFDNPKESAFHALLDKTGQLGLYSEDDFRLKYGSFSQPLPFSEQTIPLIELEDYEALALGVFAQWEEAKKQAAESSEPETGEPENVKVHDLTKDVIIEKLTELNVDFDKGAKKAELADLLAATLGKIAEESLEQTENSSVWGDKRDDIPGIKYEITK